MKIIAIMEALVLKFYFLIYILLMKRLKRIIIVYQLKWKNKIMEKLLLFFVKINPQLTQSIGTNGGNINAIALKKNEKNFISVDGNTDYEPCSTKFEEIFRDYCGNKKRKVWNMEYLAYWIEPVIIMGFNWSDDEEDTHMIEGDDEFEEEK